MTIHHVCLSLENFVLSRQEERQGRRKKKNTSISGLSDREKEMATVFFALPIGTVRLYYPSTPSICNVTKELSLSYFFVLFMKNRTIHPPTTLQ